MASANPMSLIFDTQLDNRGFMRGSGEIQNALLSLRNSLARMSGNAEQLLGFSRAAENMRAAARTAVEFRDDMSEIREAMSRANEASTFVQAQSSIETLTRLTEAYGDRVYRLEDGTGVIGRQTLLYQSLIPAIEQLRNRMTETYTSQQDLTAGMEDLDFFTNRFNETCGRIGSTRDVDVLTGAVQELRRQMEEVSRTDFTINGARINGADTEALAQMQRTLAEYEQRLEEASHSNAWNRLSAQWGELPTLSGMVSDAFRQVQDGIRRMNDELFGTQGTIHETIHTEDELREHIMAIGNAFGLMDEAGSAVQLQSVFQMLERQVEAFGNKVYELEDGRRVMGAETEEFRSASEALEILRQQMESVINAQTNMTGSYDDMDYFVQRFRATLASVDDAESLQAVQGILNELRAQMEEVANTDFSIGGRQFSGADSEEYDRMRASVEDLQRQLEQARGDTEGRIPAAFQKMGNAVKGVFSNVAQAATKVSFGIHQALTDPQGALDRLGAAAANAAGKLAAMAGGGIQSALGVIASAAANAAANLVKVGGKAVIAGLGKAGKGFLDISRRALEASKNIGKMALDKVSGAAKRLMGSLLGAGRGAQNFGKQASMSFGRVLKYAIGIQSLGALFQRLKSAVKEGFGKIVEADPELAQTVNNMKASLEQLKVSFAAAFLPLVQMVLPVIQTIINALSQAISYIGMFIAALTGQKTYKTAVANQNAAAKAANGAADAYGNAAKAAKEEQKTIAGFDDLNILQENEDGGGGGGGGGGPAYSLADSPIESNIDDLVKKLKEMWDMADFTELGKKLGESLKKLLESIPWDKIKAFAEKLGKSIATLLNGFMEVPGLFETIGKTIAEVINTVFSFLYGLVSNLHWDSLGEAIKDFITGLLNNIDWDLIHNTFILLGAGIGAALESALDNPEIWNAIFTTVSNAVEALLLLLYNLFMTPNWGGIAANIGTGLNTGVEEFPWDLLSGTISAALNSVFDFVYNFLTTFDFLKFGQHIGEEITDAVGSIDWATGGAAVAAAINALYDFLNGILVETDWKELGRSVIDAISGFFNEIDVSKWSEFVSNVWLALFEFFIGLIEAVDWAALPGNIFQKIGEFMSGFDWNTFATTAMTLLGAAIGAAVTLVVQTLTIAGGAFYDAFQNLIAGGLQGIIDALKNIGTWIKEHIFDPIIDGFEKTFDIKSPSKEMEPIGVDIIKGVGEGIKSWIAGIPTWLATHVGAPIVNGVKKLFGVGSGEPALESSGNSLIEGMKSGMSNVMNSAGNWIKKHVTDPISNAVSNNFGTDKTAVTDKDGKSLIEGLKKGISTGLTGIAGWLKNTVADPFLNNVKSPLGITGTGNDSTMFKQFGVTCMDALKNGVQSSSNNVLSTMTEIANSLAPVFQNIDWSNVGYSICSGIHSGLESGWNWLTNTAWNLAVSIFNAACRALGIRSPSKEFQWIGEMLTEGMAKGMDDTQDTATDAVRSVADAVTEEAEKAAATIKLDAAVDGLDSVLGSFSDKVVNSFAAMIARMEEIAAESSFYTPAVAAGVVGPYAAIQEEAGAVRDKIDEVLQRLDMAGMERISLGDLRDMLRLVFAEYMNFSFYLGDEQIARHANAGNVKLNRRYNTVKA